MTARRRAAAPRDAAPPPAGAAGGGAHPTPYPTVAVVVLGDVGRSPRMQYHSASLAAHPRVGGVSLVGYAGERCVDAVEADPRITQYLLGSPFARLPRSLFLLWAPLKVVYQVAQLLWTLLVAIPTPSAILVQNPPSIPALLAVWLACRLRGASMVVDWHNFGYSILAMSMGRKHAVVRLATWYERTVGGMADAHLCVTAAMAEWLHDNWGITCVIGASVLHDKPPPFFRPSTMQETHDLFARLAPSLPAAVGLAADAPASSTAATAAGSCTLLTEEVAGRGGRGSTVRLRRDRPAVLVSSTSWTADEDFGLLLDALVALDAVASAEPAAYPDFLVLVTGKGPQRAMYEARMAALPLRRVAVRTLWLSAGDYPTLLGSCDAGVCLHTSSSGLDLPMKVVDMFGAGLPVCAVGFSCLPELVRHGVNGLVFSTAAELAQQLADLFRGFPGGAPSANALARLRRGVGEFQAVRWEDNWDAVAAPLFGVR